MVNLAETPHFQDADKARTFLEKLRWPNGPVCPHCDCKTAYKLTAKANSKKPVRPGVYKCKDCEQQFTVTVNTIFEDSHIPLNKWLLAIHLLCASKKGMSAHQLHRMLGVTYKSAWFMAHRVRYMMSQPSFTQKLSGVIEADETYVGGKRRNQGGRGRPDNYSHKQAVFALVKRDGDVRSFHVERVTGENLRGILWKNAHPSSTIMTDNFASYDNLKGQFNTHYTVNHSTGEYSRKEVASRRFTRTQSKACSLCSSGESSEHIIRWEGTTFTDIFPNSIFVTTPGKSVTRIAHCWLWAKQKARGYNYGTQQAALLAHRKEATRPLRASIAAVPMDVAQESARHKIRPALERGPNVFVTSYDVGEVYHRGPSWEKE